MTRYLAVGLFGAALLPAPASADCKWLRGGEEVVSVSVSHADLDLSQPEDVAELEQRVRRAAMQLCTGERTAPVMIRLDASRCIRAATQTSIAQIAKATREEARQLAQRSGR
jgi:UrcA family protein